MNILITGIHGFVGSNLVEYLKSENEIYGLDIVSPEKTGVVKTFSWDDLDAGVVPALCAYLASYEDGRATGGAFWSNI